MEVTNRFKELDLIECLEIWTEVHDIVHETRIKNIPMEKKYKKKKKKNGCLKRPTNSGEKKRSKKLKRKGKIKASECRVPKNSKER